MKTRFTIIALCLILSGKALSQNLFVQSYMEKTHVSPKMGLQIGYEFSGGYVVSGFYQQEVALPIDQEVPRPRFYEKEFYGVLFGFPLLSWKGLDASLNVRTGVTNKINFAITPSLMLDYQLIKSIHIKGGIGIRSLNPTFIGGVSFHLNNKTHKK